MECPPHTTRTCTTHTTHTHHTYIHTHPHIIHTHHHIPDTHTHLYTIYYTLQLHIYKHHIPYSHMPHTHISQSIYLTHTHAIHYTHTHTYCWEGKASPLIPQKQQGPLILTLPQAQDCCCCCCLVASVMSDSEAQDYHPLTVAHYSFLQHVNLKF